MTPLLEILYKAIVIIGFYLAACVYIKVQKEDRHFPVPWNNLTPSPSATAIN